jgi:hypothetical protein
MESAIRVTTGNASRRSGDWFCCKVGFLLSYRNNIALNSLSYIVAECAPDRTLQQNRFWPALASVELMVLLTTITAPWAAVMWIWLPGSLAAGSIMSDICCRSFFDFPRTISLMSLTPLKNSNHSDSSLVKSIRIGVRGAKICGWVA